MPLSSYTSFDDIRAALGVSEDEIEDGTLLLPLYENKLLSEFEDISPSLAEDFLLLPSSGRTAIQDKFARNVQMFATYAVAKHLTISLPLFSPKDISDSKALQSRYASSPYKDTIAGIFEEYGSLKSRLDSVYSVIKSTTVTVFRPRVYFAVSSLQPDPVTGV